MSVKKTNRFSLYFLHPKFFFTWLGVLFLIFLAFVPIKIKDFLASKLARCLVFFFKKPVNIIKINLDRCFPEKTSKELHELTISCIERFLISAFAQGEFLFCSSKHIESRVQFIGFEEYLKPSLDNNDKILFVMPHFWGIDYACSSLSQKIPLQVMAKQYKNPIFNWLSYRLRSRYHANVFFREHGLTQFLQGWKEGKHIAFAPDEDHGDKLSKVVPFFKAEKASLPILSRIHHVYDSVIIPCAIGYNKDNRCFECQFSAPIKFQGKLSKIEDARLLNKIVEDAIKQYTPDYSWVLKIFRSQKIYN